MNTGGFITAPNGVWSERSCFFPVLGLFTAALLTVSCVSDDEDVSAPRSAEEPETSRQVWDWNAHPVSDDLLLGTLPIDVQPRRSLAIRSEGNGLMTFDVETRTSDVKRGDVIARMDVETLEEQEERLKIQEERKNLEQMKNEELDIPERRRMATEELEEAQRKVRLMEAIMLNPAMREMSSELFGSDIGEVSDASLTEARKMLNLAERKKQWADTFEERMVVGQQRLAEMDLNRSRRQHEELKERSVYTAPFDGELRLEVDYVEGQNDYTVTSRETVATLNDYTDIHALLGVSNARWINLEPEKLRLELNDADQTVMKFFDDRIQKDERTQREERKYVFSVPLGDNERLKRLTGTQMTARLVYQLPVECHIVPKYDLALYALGRTDTTEWSAMVRQIWPDAQLLAEGQNHVAIRISDDL